MIPTTNQLLEQARSCLSELIDSAFLDATEMVNDCLELFDTFDWEPKHELNETEKQRWEKLLLKGNEGELESTELTEFLELTNPKGQCHAYLYRVMARKLVTSIQDYQKEDNSRQVSIEKASKSAAAACLFDFESGELNADVAEVLSPEEVFDAVQLSSSLTISVDNVEYELEPYWSCLSSDQALEILQDMSSAIEFELIEQKNALTQYQMVDWRIESNKCLPENHREPVPEGHEKEYSVSVQLANQTAIEINDSDGEPALGLLIEINHGTPAIHIDLDGGDTLIHIHKGQGGLVITPDSQRKSFEQAKGDALSYNDPNALVIKA